MTKSPVTGTVLAIVLGLFIGAAPAAEWGDLKVRFAWDGEPPKPTMKEVTKDAKVCGKEVLDESLVVDAKGGLRDVVVHVVLKGDEKLEHHPDYDRDLPDKVVIAAKNCRFEPHITLVRVGQTLTVVNRDDVGHGVAFQPQKNTRTEPIIGRRDEAELGTMRSVESYPAGLVCRIHPWMHALVVIEDHPYMSVSGSAGELSIKNLPAGKHTLRIWHERFTKIQRGDSTPPITNGRCEVEIKPGENDLGVILLKLEK